jgi:hypothetical protein
MEGSETHDTNFPLTQAAVSPENKPNDHPNHDSAGKVAPYSLREQASMVKAR